MKIRLNSLLREALAALGRVEVTALIAISP
jgi:hypothetical protein